MTKDLIKNGILVLSVLVAVVVFTDSLIAQDVEITDEKLKIYAVGLNRLIS